MLKRMKHWNARYVVDRVQLFVYEKRHPAAPWLTKEMTSLLECWLKATDKGVEWGSGRSTLWLAKLVGHVTTVEENSSWAKYVSEMLNKAGCAAKVSLNEVPISAEDRANPGQSGYVLAQSSIADASLDFALVDGDLRDECALVAINKLKPRGILIIDNVERYIEPVLASKSPARRMPGEGGPSEAWNLVWATIKDWRCVWTSNGVTDTAFWVKP
jgi:predicted O-methyltransferase YrrM